MLKAQQDDKPYRLVDSIIRGTNVGRAFTLMGKGVQCAFETEAQAMVGVEMYLDCAAAVLDHVPSGVCFGVLTLLDTRDGSIVLNEVLMGRDTQTTLGK